MNKSPTKETLTTLTLSCVNRRTEGRRWCGRNSSINVITKHVMKMKSLLAFVSAFALAASLAVAEDDTPLSKEMSAMNKALRALKKTAQDPAHKAANLAAVDKM